MVRWLGGVTVLGIVGMMGAPAIAQTCTSLKVVGAPGTRIEKTVSVPGAGLIARNNWNTDFTVPRGQSFRSYVATVTPKSTANFSIQMSLKYPNNAADTVFNQKVELKQDKPFTMTGSPRIGVTPFQVNLSVGGVEAVGSNYTVSVVGCR